MARSLLSTGTTGLVTITRMDTGRWLVVLSAGAAALAGAAGALAVRADRTGPPA
jgi:hypothetical protein